MKVFWFRRDLRTDDNTALAEALKGNEKVLPIFIFDRNILEDLPKNDARLTFIHQSLSELSGKIDIAFFHDTPESVFKKLASEHEITDVFANEDYEPYAKDRDGKIGTYLKSKNIGFHLFKDQVIFGPDEVLKDNGEPYVVYTPYSKRWLEKLGKEKPTVHRVLISDEKITAHSHRIPTLKALGFEKSAIEFPSVTVSEKTISEYGKERDFPAIDSTSRIGLHLRFGTVSIRKLVGRAMDANDNTYLKELIWREFFMQILAHFPKSVTKAFKPEYDHIKWRYSEKDFEKWCEGKTGYPMVDAGMRQLNETGFMHNRVRMVCASFLCKHLLLDWRKGEAYFAEKLLDYEQSSNIGNWQWAAGSGVDAAPYFRIFNPEEQLKKFDKDQKYIKKWLREFGSDAYPKPMVDHKEARERCLKVYKEGLNR